MRAQYDGRWNAPAWGAYEPAYLRPWAPPERPRHKRGVVFLIPVVVLAMIVALVAFSVSLDDDPDWDARIAPLAAFVEETRGLEFDHAVPVAFLSQEEWEESVAVDESSLTDEDRAADEESVESMRSLGLVDGDFDLNAESNELAADIYIASFDPYADRIQVLGDPGDTFDVATQGTIVHELTHALQHQHFDLVALQEHSDDGSWLAVSGLVEGDATAIERAWVDSLPAAERNEYYGAYEDVEDPGADAPAGLSIAAALPYSLGPPLTNLLWDHGRLDASFDIDTPWTEEHLLDPLSFIDGDNAKRVNAPEVPEGADRLEGSTSFGAIGLFVMLAERIDPHVALMAADGWDGDAPVSYRLDGRQCMRVNFLAEDTFAKDAMSQALGAWVESLPEPFASTEVDGPYVFFETCDPGSDVELTTGDAYPAMVLPELRAWMMYDFATKGDENALDRCMADRIVADMTVDEATTFFYSDDDWLSDEHVRRVNAKREECLQHG